MLTNYEQDDISEDDSVPDNEINQNQDDQLEEDRIALRTTAANVNLILQRMGMLEASIDVLGVRVGRVEVNNNTASNASTTQTPLHQNVTGRSSRSSRSTSSNNNSGGRPSLGHLPVMNTLSTTKTLVSEFVIQEHQMLRGEVNLKLIGWLYDTYDHYKNTSADKSKTLIAFISKAVVRSMLDNEALLGSDLGKFCTESTAYQCTDEQTSQMLCNLVRPKSRNEYIVKFMDAVTKPDFKDAKFDTEQWHQRIHKVINKVLRDVVRYDDYLRRHASAEELNMMPKHNWGKGKGRGEGLFRMVMKLFSPHDEKITNLIGESNLKNMTSLDEFVQAIQALNNKKGNTSLNLLRENEEMEDPLDTKEVILKSKSKDMQKKLLKGVSEKRVHQSGNSNRLNQLDSTTSTKTNPCDDDEYDLPEDMYIMKGAGYSKPQNKNNDKGITKKLPCYVFATRGNCEAGAACIYSHDIKDAQAFLEKELRKTIFSPYYNDAIMQQARAAGKIETKFKPDKSAPLVKPTSYDTPSRGNQHGDHKQLDGQTVPSPRTEEKNRSTNYDGYSTSTSESSRVAPNSEPDAGVDEDSDSN